MPILRAKKLYAGIFLFVIISFVLYLSTCVWFECIRPAVCELCAIRLLQYICMCIVLYMKNNSLCVMFMYLAVDIHISTNHT